MLKKILLASVAAVGLAVPFAAAPAANAGEHGRERFEHRHHCEYEVLYRRCDREPWSCRGEFESRYRAHEVAERLRCRGFEVRIVER
jgi:hypothetical protein